MDENVLDKVGGHDHKMFWAMYILYVIIGLVAIILTGMVLRGGTQSKGLLWTLFAINLLLFVATIYLMYTGSKLFAGIVLFLQFIVNLAALILTNERGNIGAEYPGVHFTSTGRYTSAVVFTVLYFLVGIGTIYFKPSE
jgi:hypothetical protein